MLNKQELFAKLKVDKFNLDKACEEHSVLATEVTSQASIAKINAKAMKANWDETKARVEMMIRDEHKGKGLTESTFAALVNVHLDVKKARDDYFVAEVEAADWSGLVVGYDHRRSMIGNLVDLNVTDYYQGKDIIGRGDRLMKRIEREKRGIDGGEEI